MAKSRGIKAANCPCSLTLLHQPRPANQLHFSQPATMFRKGAVWMVMAVGLWMCQSALAADKASEAAEKVDKTQVVTTTTPVTPSSDLNIPQNLMQILTNGGAVAVGLAVVAALAALAMPMFGVRYCQLLGNCDNAYQYNANSVYQNDMYGQYPQATYPSPTGNSYQKRSIEYVGPVLHMLKAAYDKYGVSALATPKKSS